jgi:MFS family permease
MRIWLGIVPALLIVHLPAASLFGSTGYGLAQMWEISPLQSTWLQAAFVVAYAARIFVGRFVMRIASDRFVFLVGFVLALAASWLFFVYASSFVWALLLLSIAGGAAGAMMYPALNMVSPNPGSPASIGLGLVVVLGWSGSIYLSQIAGTVNVSSLAGFIPAGGGWNTIYLLTALLGAIWVIPAYFLIPKRD